MSPAQAQPPRPLGLLAELTYRCPLHCPYCSNPTRLAEGLSELGTQDWKRVLEEAAQLGVMHVMFSGGEPLQRPDLAELVACARQTGLYTNLITSAVGLTRARAGQLKQAGLDSVQISFQSDQAAQADGIAGATAHAVKLEAAALVRSMGFPLTVNVVLHQGNLDRLGPLIAMAEALDAQRLELANTQYYGWAFRNQAALMPSLAQVESAERIAVEAARRLAGRMEVLYVKPDYYGTRPKPCMNGWGRRYITVNPAGQVLPCPTSGEIPNLRFDSVLEKPLGWIWRESEAFNLFRGTEWMPEPCQSCDQREVDFGGCRCQAALLTGDARNTDPACDLSPFRETLTAVLGRAQAPRAAEPPAFRFRTNPMAGKGLEP
jgi:pyrroloquinoline quinone biosynthesis protein E